MNPESQTPKRSPRSTYAKLRDEANIVHDRRKLWNLKPRDSHTLIEKQRLANQSWENKYRDLIASMAPGAIVDKSV